MSPKDAMERSLPVRCVLGAVCALVWGCAVLRLATGQGGSVESLVAAGGWGLGLLPVHASTGSSGRVSTRASPRRRSDAESAPW